MQLKRVLTLILTVVFVFSLAAPVSAVDAVYSVSPDTSVLSAPIYYTEGYYPGAVDEMRNAGIFANRIAHGSYSGFNYNPTFSRVATAGVSTERGDFNSLIPIVIADVSDVSAVYSFADFYGDRVNVILPSTDDCYFDFQSSNFLFDQQSPNANTFYVNGDLTFSLRNLWNFNSTAWYLASDPLAVQLLIDGQAYGDIIDVTGYTSPFTALYNGGLPTNATVTFDNMKIYYQGDTPDMIGFRVYTGSAFLDGSYSYNDSGDIEASNTITFRCSEMPDITFVQEGGDGYAGDLSGISGFLNQIASGIDTLINTRWISTFRNISLMMDPTWSYLTHWGSVGTLNTYNFPHLINSGFLGLRTFLVDSSGTSWLSKLYNVSLAVTKGTPFLTSSGNSSITGSDVSPFSDMFSMAMVGLSTNIKDFHSYFSNAVFPWQSYNMETHQLNAATNVTGQNNLFFTAFQSMEDKLGRLAYVFGSDEDLALKDSADPGTDAFRDNFGGGLSLGQIKDGADVVKGVNGLFDSGYDFGDAFSEISGDSMFTMWFSSQNAAALDSTSSVMALDDEDPYNMQIYYDRIHEVTAKRDREEGDTND